MPGDVHSAMRLFEQIPMPALRSFVTRFLVVEFPRQHRDAHLPDLRSVAAFSLHGECRFDGGQRVAPAAFTGPRATLRTHEHRDGHAVLLATFTPAGAAAFVRAPLEEFTGATTELAGLLGRADELEQLHEQLVVARNHARRVRLLEGFLLARLREPAPDPLVTAAVAWLERERGGGRIDELTRYIGLSQSALERRFRRVVGVSPKKYASVVRLSRAVALREGGADFATAAYAAGYADQSHFIHEFRRATGRAPAEFFRSGLNHE